MFSRHTRLVTPYSRTAALTALLLSGFLLASCSVPEGANNRPIQPTDAEVEQYNASVDPEERIVCRDEISVGSNIPERKCRYVRDIQATSTFHREQLRNILR